jgi:hypothetical protein
MPPFANTGDLDILAPIRNIADKEFYKSLSFVGVFERDGRKVNLIDARTKDGYYLALAFDRDAKSVIGLVCGALHAGAGDDFPLWESAGIEALREERGGQHGG